jgi:hypothetical protein
MACCAILIDAEVCGKLRDDRPPKAPVSDQIDRLSEVVGHLKELFKDENPYQYTIKDSKKADKSLEEIDLDGFLKSEN